MMSALIGLGLAVFVAAFAHVVGFDRDRVFYPLVLIVIASYYDLFAVIGGSHADLTVDTVMFCLFAGAAVVGFRSSLWVVVAALALHGVFDLFHHSMIEGSGVPAWWPRFCLTYDFAAAACLAVLLYRGAGLPYELRQTGRFNAWYL